MGWFNSRESIPSVEGNIYNNLGSQILWRHQAGRRSARCLLHRTWRGNFAKWPTSGVRQMYTPSEGSCFLSRTDRRHQENRCWVRSVRSIPVVNDQGALDVACRSLPPVRENRRGYIYFSQSGLLDHRMLSKWIFLGGQTAVKESQWRHILFESTHGQTRSMHGTVQWQFAVQFCWISTLRGSVLLQTHHIIAILSP